MHISWITQTTGIANYDDVKRLYANNRACQPADGKPMDCEPRAGHVHLIGSNHDPIQITVVDKLANKVVFKKVPFALGMKLHKNFIGTTKRGFEIGK